MLSEAKFKVINGWPNIHLLKPPYVFGLAYKLKLSQKDSVKLQENEKRRRESTDTRSIDLPVYVAIFDR